MIRIEFSLAVAIYLVMTALIVMLVWLIFEKRKPLQPISQENRFFWQCNVCTYVYVDSKHNVISKCPRCESYNKREEDLKKGG